jgi:beta-lactamase class C
MTPAFSRRLATAIVFTALVTPGARASDSAGLRAIVDKAIRPVMAKYDVPGMAVGVTINGRAYFFNYGVASKKDPIAVSETTLFELGSLSKTFTATLASYAQAQGKLSFDDHPGKYMPALEGSPIDKARLVNLGTYTAGGLPLQFPDKISDATMPDFFRRWKPAAAPDTQRLYSNPSIGLLGYITALALHSDFADAVETDIFPSLGLKNTYIRVPAKAMGRYAWGYDKANKAIRVNPGVFDQEAYGVKSTSADMIRFLQANIDPAGLDKPMQRAIEGTHRGYFKAGDMVQGLGWEQYAYPVTAQVLLAGNAETMMFEPNAVRAVSTPQAFSGPVLFNKTGSTNGFGAYAVFVPAKKIGIVILANKSYPVPARVTAAYAILENIASPAP